MHYLLHAAFIISWLDSRSREEALLPMAIFGF